jgi:hypothetical protein
MSQSPSAEGGHLMPPAMERAWADCARRAEWEAYDRLVEVMPVEDLRDALRREARLRHRAQEDLVRREQQLDRARKLILARRDDLPEVFVLSIVPTLQ